jgi:hypothetical protein
MYNCLLYTINFQPNKLKTKVYLLHRSYIKQPGEWQADDCVIISYGTGKTR